MVSRTEEEEKEEERRARLVLGGRCIQPDHDCKGTGCTDRNHRRDAAFLRHCLELTGLINQPDMEKEGEKG